MSISLIAAIGKNGELGESSRLLWSLPKDMKHFKETTSGHTVVMGRKTFENIGKILPNRRNIILTKDPHYRVKGAQVVHSLEETQNLLRNEDENIFIIGGEQIYKMFLEHANRLYITHVDETFPNADTFFPEIDLNVWNKVSSKEHKADEKNPYNYTFVVYEKLTK